MSASSRAPPSATRTYSRPRERAIDFAIERLADAGRADEEQDRPARHRARFRLARIRDRPVLGLPRRQRGRRVVLRGTQLRRGDLSRRLDLGGQLLGAQLPHGEELEHAILHVPQPVVVLVEDLLRALEVERIIGARVPRELRDPLEIRADHLRLHRLATRALQAPQLALDLGAGLLRQLELHELVPQLGHLAARVVVPELLLNRLELLAQIHLALALPQLLLHLRLDLLLGLEQADLPLDVHEHPAEPLLDAQRLQQPLLLRDAQLDVAGHQVGEAPRLRHGVQHLADHLLRQPPLLSELGRPLAQFLVQRLERRVVFVEGTHLLRRHHDRRHVSALGRRVLHRRRALLSLQEQLHAPQAALDLPDARDHPHRVQDVGGRLIHVFPLRDREDETLLLERCLDRAQSPRSARGNRCRAPGEDRRAAKRQDG